MNTKTLFAVVAICCATMASAQSRSAIEALAVAQPKKQQSFPIDHLILQPSLQLTQWDELYDYFYAHLPVNLRRTQMGLSYVDNGVSTWLCTPAALGHAQLDTTTRIYDENKLKGTWRAVSNRTIRFNDSIATAAGQIYRQDTLLEDYKDDDVFAVLDGKHIDIYAKEAGSSKFKNKMSGKYMLESNRYIVLYKFIKASGGISQVGIDKEGRLIMQVSSVIEHKAPGRYISYYAVVNQLIYEKVQ